MTSSGQIFLELKAAYDERFKAQLEKLRLDFEANRPGLRCINKVVDANGLIEEVALQLDQFSLDTMFVTQRLCTAHAEALLESMAHVIAVRLDQKE